MEKPGGIFVIMFLLLCNNVSGYDYPTQLYILEKGVRAGDKAAFLQLIPYLDSNRLVNDPLGYHVTIKPVNAVAYRLIKENTSFLHHEFSETFNDSIDCRHLKQILQENTHSIYFDFLASVWLLTPMSKRSTNFEIKEYPASRLEKIYKAADSIMNQDWVINSDIKYYVLKEDPKALLHIAYTMYRNRDRYNEYDFDVERYTDLIGLLTHTIVGVPDEDSELVFRLRKFDNDITNENYLIYWLNHYKDYQWNYEKHFFENKKYAARRLSDTYLLFELLNNEDDSTAISAYVTLTERPHDTIEKYIGQFDANNKNYILPTFHFIFLDQLSKFTEYCRVNGISYFGSAQLKEKISVLCSDSTSFATRYKVENELINTLTLSEITSFEYWALIYQNNQMTFSAGRIIDKFYSKNWTELTNNRDQLNLYLKKAYLYSRLGIIGSCGYYPDKFFHCDTFTKQQLHTLMQTTKDSMVKSGIRDIVYGQIDSSLEVILNKLNADKNYEHRSKRVGDIAHPVHISGLAQRVALLKRQNLTETDLRNEVLKIIDVVTYKQLDTALSILRDTNLFDAYYIYRFLGDHFGFPNPPSRKASELDSFTDAYRRLPKHQFYAYYLQKAGISYRTASGELDYPKIYDILKYNIVTAFSGGGGSYKNYGVYAIIKILEHQFQTMLGYPDKNIHTQEWNSYYDFIKPRSLAWIDYLRQHNVLPANDTEPISFGLR